MLQIHVTCLDFSLLSAFAPFWVYNDMTSRKWYEKGSWLLPISLVPFLGPSLYLVLRPSLSELPASTVSNLIRTEVLDRKAKTDDVENK
uniref:Cardiolipin synthase N-terminal domain-containing protein n=1 Tax=Rhizophora mucronata TaxID=61149 RepID=A0A2P2MLY3_RHIMU